nr:hypothetical protein Iba_chr11bCG0010 [Ipomoea batatas]
MQQTVQNHETKEPAAKLWQEEKKKGPQRELFRGETSGVGRGGIKKPEGENQREDLEKTKDSWKEVEGDRRGFKKEVKTKNKNQGVGKGSYYDVLGTDVDGDGDLYDTSQFRTDWDPGKREDNESSSTEEGELNESDEEFNASIEKRQFCSTTGGLMMVIPCCGSAYTAPMQQQKQGLGTAAPPGCLLSAGCDFIPISADGNRTWDPGSSDLEGDSAEEFQAVADTADMMLWIQLREMQQIFLFPVLQQQHIHNGWVLLPLLVAAIGLAGNTAELCTARLAMQLRGEGIWGFWVEMLVELEYSGPHSLFCCSNKAYEGHILRHEQGAVFEMEPLFAAEHLIAAGGRGCRLMRQQFQCYLDHDSRAEAAQQWQVTADQGFPVMALAVELVLLLQSERGMFDEDQSEELWDRRFSKAVSGLRLQHAQAMATMADSGDNGLYCKGDPTANLNQKNDPPVIVIDEEGIARVRFAKSPSVISDPSTSKANEIPAKEQLCDVLVNGRIDLESLGVPEQIRDNDEVILRAGIKDKPVWKPTGDSMAGPPPSKGGLAEAKPERKEARTDGGNLKGEGDPIESKENRFVLIDEQKSAEECDRKKNLGKVA